MLETIISRFIIILSKTGWSGYVTVYSQSIQFFWLIERKSQMDQTKVILDRDYQIAAVDPRLFGGFLEHIGRAIYEGVYDPQSKQSDENGFRKDVLQSLKPLRFTAMRYPGGNFASGYHWSDGVGPRDGRPTI